MSQAAAWRIRPAAEKDQADWCRLRGQLWPDGADQHVVELADHFAGRSIDIEHAEVAVDDGDRVIGFIELNLRDFAEGRGNRACPTWKPGSWTRRGGGGASVAH